MPSNAVWLVPLASCCQPLYTETCNVMGSAALSMHEKLCKLLLCQRQTFAAYSNWAYKSCVCSFMCLSIESLAPLNQDHPDPLLLLLTDHDGAAIIPARGGVRTTETPVSRWQHGVATAIYGNKTVCCIGRAQRANSATCRIAHAFKSPFIPGSADYSSRAVSQRAFEPSVAAIRAFSTGR